ncbi:hypothetical protein [Rickettsia oklahomensis]|uniref:Uncharacterized protein n=1 Tax=Rickettsia oklahomensis TaxID=3141789 RepID=A0AAU7BYX4_9RICK
MSCLLGVVVWIGKICSIAPWLDHGVHKNIKKIGYRGQTTV